MPVGPREIEDAKALGIELQTVEVGEVEILVPNWLSVAAFGECRSQWRTASGQMGIAYIGLDYTAVKLVLDDLDCPKGVFADIRFMEAAALEVLNTPED